MLHQTSRTGSVKVWTWHSSCVWYVHDQWSWFTRATCHDVWM